MVEFFFQFNYKNFQNYTFINKKCSIIRDDGCNHLVYDIRKQFQSRVFEPWALSNFFKNCSKTMLF